MLRYTISLILLTIALSLQSQVFKDLEEGRRPFVRLSFDPTISLKSYLQDPNLVGFEAAIDSEIKQNTFAIAEVGNLSTIYDSDDFRYANNGLYARVGLDINLTKYRKPSDRDIFFIGGRFGFSTFNQKVDDIILDNYWGEKKEYIPDEIYSAMWIEIVAGVKAEMTKNLFIGWTGRAKVKTYLSSGEISPYIIPGFGKNDSRIAFAFNIYLSYAIFLKK
jgi:hypothetical protein